MITNSLEAAVVERMASREPAVIEVSGLRKRYRDHEAVRGIDLEVFRGEIFAFLGPNGAGKTTTVEILEGFRAPSAGSVRVLGVDPARPARAGGAWRERIGIVLQESAPEAGLTVRECLALYSGYYRAPRPIQETLELAGLTEVSEQRAVSLSGGERRRLDVALALIGDPVLIFLDEPTTGFDPSARRAAWTIIDGLRRLGKPRTLGGRDTSAARVTFTLPPGTSAALDLPPLLAERADPQGDGRVTLTSAAVATDLHASRGGRSNEAPSSTTSRCAAPPSRTST